MAYRPTVYHLLAFIAPEKKGELEKPRIRERRDSTSSVSSYLSQVIENEAVSLQSRAADLLQNKASKIAEKTKPLPKNWLRNQVQVSLSLQSLAVLVNADSGHGIVFAGITGITAGVSVCPAAVTVTGSLTDVCVRDVSRGCGVYPFFLQILDKKEEEKFVDFDLILNTDIRYPKHPGYPMAVRAIIRAPALTLRMRVVDELMRYVLAGPIADGLKLLKTEESSVRDTLPDSVPLDTIQEDDEVSTSTNTSVSVVSNRSSLARSIRASAMMVGKSFLNMETKESEKKLPLELPLIDVVIKNFRVSAPASSDTEEVATFELGELTVKNQAPFCEQTDGVLIVNEASKKDTLNTVRVQLSNMRAITSIATEGTIRDLALLGGIDMSVTAVVASVIEVNARVTKVALSVNEQQIAFIMKCVKGNLAEKAVECLDELPEKTSPTEKAAPIYKEAVLERIEEDEETDFQPVKQGSAPSDFGKRIRGEFVFDGISIELLSGYGGYPAEHTGKLLYEKVGTLNVRIVLCS